MGREWGSCSASIGGFGNAEQFKDLSLKVRQLGLEASHVLAILLEDVTLGEAEQAEHLLGGGTSGGAFLGIEWERLDGVAL